MARMFYFARCMNIIFNLLLVQLIKYDVHTTRKIKSIHTIFYHILSLYLLVTNSHIRQVNTGNGAKYVYKLGMLNNNRKIDYQNRFSFSCLHY